MTHRYKTICKKIDYWQDRLSEFQENCQHTNVVKTPKSDTGNWDKYSDSYWYEFKCPDCGKFWREDQ